MNNVIVQDVCEVLIQDTDSNKMHFFGLTTKNDVTQKIKQDILKGGIGNGSVGVIQSDKELTFKVNTLLHNDDIYAIQSGSDFVTGAVTVTKSEEGAITTGKVAIKGTPVGSNVTVIDSTGKTLTGTYATGQVTVTGGTEGDIVTVLYSESEATAQALTLDSRTFPKNYKVQLHTIAYDLDTNEVTADIYWIFDKALPDGGIQAQYEAGKQNGDEIGFTAQLKRGSTKYGQYVVVPTV